MRYAKGLVPGLLLGMSVAALAYGLSQAGWAKEAGLGALTLAIVFGALIGNVFPQTGTRPFLAGLAFSQSRLLRFGVALYGFNLSAQQILQVGKSGVLVDVLMVTTTLLCGWFVGTRLLKMERETVILTTAGSAICGAAAVVAMAPVLGVDEDSLAEKSSVAVATVVLFGTLAMLVYPLLYPWLGRVGLDFGTYVGSTVHEVAQVMAVGNALGSEVAASAVIVKMIRVMLLIPFLLLLGTLVTARRRGPAASRPLAVPWFAFAFVAIAGFNSLHLLPPEWVQLLRNIGQWLLAVAMVALGVGTTWQRVRRAGIRPLILGACLFLHLVCVGGFINYLLD